MGKVLAIANQKGGVGKTTTSVNLAASLTVTRKNVLLIDLDPQGNATTGSGIDKASLSLSIYDLLSKNESIEEVLLRPEAGYDLLPANGDLVASEVELMAGDDREARLRSIVDVVRSNYDFIVIDCPPSLNMLTINALVAADGVVIPMQCEYYALEGLSALMDTISAIRDRLNPSLKIEGILRTMYDPRSKLTSEVNGQLFNYFGDAVYRTVVPRNVRLAEAPSYGKPVIKYDKQSRGAIAYLALAGELLRRHDEAAAGVSG
ncbi:MAG: ParA family protein [Pseudomonadota bacterium]|nr:AAA family ATPase [Pseudomonadales bacterium]MEE3290985.1 ParA family protein [Pseudomonadota bacterium]GIT21922.1 MAG: chromosome partitioning protein Soj [Gammaproteobacteria bacterium]GIT64250.1 MAG: chromosome partitioning protein Soj [Gammaproteobacteria bacterium]